MNSEFWKVVTNFFQLFSASCTTSTEVLGMDRKHRLDPGCTERGGRRPKVVCRRRRDTACLPCRRAKVRCIGQASSVCTRCELRELAHLCVREPRKKPGPQPKRKKAATDSSSSSSWSFLSEIRNHDNRLVPEEATSTTSFSPVDESPSLLLHLFASIKANNYSSYASRSSSSSSSEAVVDHKLALQVTVSSGNIAVNHIRTQGPCLIRCLLLGSCPRSSPSCLSGAWLRRSCRRGRSGAGPRLQCNCFHSAS